MRGEKMKISVEKAGGRLDIFLTEHFGGDHTRSQITSCIKNGSVTLNGGIVKPGTILKSGDIIEASIERPDVPAEPQEMDICVLYQDEHIMVINKPRGLVVHPGAGNRQGTLLNGLLFFQKNDANLVRGGIVHRLDKNTAGLMIVAKTALAQARLSAMFEKREVKRVYVGLIEGVAKDSGGVIESQIIRDPKKRTLFKASSSGGKRAITHWQVIKVFSKWTLARFELVTGRTHQIRVHCKYINHPIVGDPEYNLNSSIKTTGGQLLESVKLQFVHPITQKDMEFSTEYTDELQSVLERISKT